ncbi:MAG: DUF6132 family protein [Candidatus Aadella gelida]|nr:DUF6132 family protein [Candidatus Aadella gelida]
MIKILLGAIIGGGIGFAVGYFGKCSTGMCPLTSDPYISTILGLLIGVMIAIRK